MKISIITPTLNQAHFIEHTIKSVLNQDYENYEHIVIDGGSTDGTVDILKKYPHIKWISEKDSGQSDAINKGLKIANGDIVTWLNSDDYFEENIFLRIANIFIDNTNCNILYGDIVYIDEQNNFLFKQDGNHLSYEELVKNPDIVRQPSTFFRKTIIDKIGGVDVNFHLVMDYNLILSILKENKLFYIPLNLSYYRYYNNTKTNRMLKEQAIELYKVYKKNNIPIKLNQYVFIVKRFINGCYCYNFFKKIIKYE